MDTQVVSDTAAVPASFIRRDDRGTFIDLVQGGRWETVITGRMNPGAVLGNHYHKRTEMFFFVTEGSCRVDIECVTTGRRWRVGVPTGHGGYLRPYQSHAIRFEAESAFILLKSRAYDPADPDTYEHPVPDITEEGARCGTG